MGQAKLSVNSLNPPNKFEGLNKKTTPACNRITPGIKPGAFGDKM
jgi:hypothetical protein